MVKTICRMNTLLLAIGIFSASVTQAQVQTEVELKFKPCDANLSKLLDKNQAADAWVTGYAQSARKAGEKLLKQGKHYCPEILTYAIANGGKSFVLLAPVIGPGFDAIVRQYSLDGAWISGEIVPFGMKSSFFITKNMSLGYRYNNETGFVNETVDFEELLLKLTRSCEILVPQKVEAKAAELIQQHKAYLGKIRILGASSGGSGEGEAFSMSFAATPKQLAAYIESKYPFKFPVSNRIIEKKSKECTMGKRLSFYPLGEGETVVSCLCAKVQDGVD